MLSIPPSIVFLSRPIYKSSSMVVLGNPPMIDRVPLAMLAPVASTQLVIHPPRIVDSAAPAQDSREVMRFRGSSLRSLVSSQSPSRHRRRLSAGSESSSLSVFSIGVGPEASGFRGFGSFRFFRERIFVERCFGGVTLRSVCS
jgi:hypothetical protein